MSKENYGEYAYWCYGLKSEYNKHYHYLTIYTWLQLKHGDISIPVSLKSFLFSWYLVIFYFYFLIFFLFVIGFQMVLNSNYYRVKFTRAHADGTWPIFTAFHNITKRVWLLLFIVNCFLTLKSSHQYAYPSFCSLPFPMVLTRNLFNSQNLFCWWSFPLFLWPKCLIQGWYCKEK